MVMVGSLTLPTSKSVIGFDAEWTKNYKIKNGNIPFCFSIVALPYDDIDLHNLISGEMPFRYIQFYCENQEEVANLIVEANACINCFTESMRNSILCGHQLSSDLSVLINYAHFIGVDEISSIEKLQARWHNRNEDCTSQIFDTRYDIYQDFLGKSRRLVDMSNDFLLDVSQPELGHSSMTKLHLNYLSKRDESIRERISVMNIRHSLCAAILYYLNGCVSNGGSLQPININKILNYNLSHDFKWIESTTFRELVC